MVQHFHVSLFYQKINFWVFDKHQLLLNIQDPVLFYTSETGISSELSVPLAVQQFRKNTDYLNLATKTVEFSNSDSSQDLPTLIWNITNNVETTPQSWQFLNQGGSLIVETEAVVSKSIVSCKLADRRYFFASSDIKWAQYQVLKIQVCQIPIVINTNYVGYSLEYQLNNAYTKEEIAIQFICSYRKSLCRNLLMKCEKFWSLMFLRWFLLPNS